MANLIANSYPTWSEWFTPTSGQNVKRSFGTIIIPALDESLEIGLCAGLEIEFKNVVATPGAVFDIQTYNTLDKLNVPWSANLLNLDYAPKNGVYTFAYLFELDDTVHSGDNFNFGISTSGWQSGQYRVRNLFTTKELVKYEPPTVDDYVTSVNGQTGDVTIDNIGVQSFNGKTGEVVVPHLVIGEDSDLPTPLSLNADTLEGHNAAFFTTLINAKQDKITHTQITLTASGWNSGSQTASGWNSGSQTASVSGILADGNKQVVIPVPIAADADKYYRAGIAATSTGTGTITFRTVKKPDVDLKVNVVLIPVQ